jgi:hypothetical protein
MTNSEILLYQTHDGQTKIDVRLEEDSVWLSQAQMSELFQKERSVITKHINNIFEEGELMEERVCANFAHTTQHGAIKEKTQTQNVKLYNLDVVISVGYRVKSLRGTQFRIWATERLREYLIKGFTMNDDLLKRGGGYDLSDGLALSEAVAFSNTLLSSN